MDKSSDKQFIIMQATIESNKQDIKAKNQDYDERMMKLTQDFKAILTPIMDHISTLKYFPTENDSTKAPNPTTVVLSNRRDPPLDN